MTWKWNTAQKAPLLSALFSCPSLRTTKCPPSAPIRFWDAFPADLRAANLLHECLEFRGEVLLVQQTSGTKSGPRLHEGSAAVRQLSDDAAFRAFVRSGSGDVATRGVFLACPFSSLCVFW